MERDRRTPSALGVNVKCGSLIVLDSPCCTQMAMVTAGSLAQRRWPIILDRTVT